MNNRRIIRSSFTGHPITKTSVRIFLYHHPDAERIKFSVGSRWETFKESTSFKKAEAFFENFIIQNS